MKTNEGVNMTTCSEKEEKNLGVARKLLTSLMSADKDQAITLINENFVMSLPVSVSPKPISGTRSFGRYVEAATQVFVGEAKIEEIAAAESARMSPQQQRLVGLFGGGTLAQEAWHLLLNVGEEKVYSNVALDQEFKIRGDEPVDGHLLIDLGDDIFTQGRPHPMIEPSLRDEHVYALAQDGSVALLLVDLVLGYGAHRDPASGLAAAIAQVKKTFAERGSYLSVVASITGTNADPQGYSRQWATLADAGVIVTSSNEAATQLAHAILTHITR
jgi:hypothetical protein